MISLRRFLMSTLLLTSACGSTVTIPSMPTMPDVIFNFMHSIGDKIRESTSSEHRHETEAASALAAKNYPKAIELYGKLSEETPANVEYRLRLADSMRLNGDWAKARTIYEALISEAPAGSSYSTDAIEGKGLCYLQEANFNEAVKAFTVVIERDSTRWRTINALGVSLTLSKRYKDALEYYKLALQLSNNHPSVINNIALAYALAGNSNQAILMLDNEMKADTITDDQRKRIALNLALVYGINGKMHHAEAVSEPYLSKAAIYNNLSYYATLSRDKVAAHNYIEKSMTGGEGNYQKASNNMQLTQ